MRLGETNRGVRRVGGKIIISRKDEKVYKR